MLIDHADTEINLVVDGSSKLGDHVRKHTQATAVPGSPGMLHVALKFMLLLVGTVARPDVIILSTALCRF